MANLTKPAEKPVSGTGAAEFRREGERARPRLNSGSSPLQVVIEMRIIASDHSKKIENVFGCDDCLILDAARSVAKCWLSNGMDKEARELIKSYGLDEKEIRAAGSCR